MAKDKLPLDPGDIGPLVTEMQKALIAKGYSVGPKGPTGKFEESTTTALEAFQDNAALKVRPRCDEECWSALGLQKPA